jgi:HEAT repeat protein
VTATRPTVRTVAVAGHTGDVDGARAGMDSDDAAVRAAALGALERLGVLDAAQLSASLADAEPAVRRRAATIAARHPEVELLAALADPDASVIEVVAWACGEREDVSDGVLDRLIALATDAKADALVRESSVAALGAIGDERGLDAILAATTDKPAIRRRAVLALAPYLDPDHPRATDVDAALQRSLADRDWQVRQAAEDLAPTDD